MQSITRPVSPLGNNSGNGVRTIQTVVKEGVDSEINTKDETGLGLEVRDHTLRSCSVADPEYSNGVDNTWKKRPSSSESGHQSTMKLSKELKSLGNKARARLEEEKSKRPEIQRLEQIPAVNPQATGRYKTVKTAFSTNVASRNVTAAPSSRKRKLATSLSQAKLSTRARGSSWAPDISHITLPARDDRSFSVRLHGLPVDCTIEHVMRFFTGLKPDSVSILLPNDVHIHQLDAMDRSPMDEFETLESSRVRVVADFSSPAAALLASERSGETIRMPSSATQDEHHYVVGVTVLGKGIADGVRSLV
jgi:hypothetical protein